MHSLVLQSLAAFAEYEEKRIALRSAGQELSYRELWKRVQQLAAELRERKIHCAGLKLDNGIEWCIADLASILAEVALVPLPPFFTEAQREHALRFAGAQALIGKEITSLPYAALTLPQGTAKITYTSGTTGSPKGVFLTQNSMEAVSHSLLQVIGAENAQRHLALLPLAVLLENVAGFYTTLLAGGCYIVEPLASLGFQGMQPNGSVLLKHLQEQRVTSCILVPEYLQALTDALEKNLLPLPDLRFMAVGGAKVSEALLAKAQALGLPVYQGYGLSETASVVAVNTPQANKPGSVGKILPHLHCRITADGELLIGAHATGDLVRMNEDGFLFIEGRKRNVIITAHGRNISPEWPESELLARPEIAQALVIGEAKPFLAALIVPASPEVNIAKAIAAVNAYLPEYAQIKKWCAVEPFTPANGMLTANGRPVRDRIMESYADLIEELYESKEKKMDFFERLQKETEAERQALYAIPVIRDAMQGKISKATYLAFLEQAYHHVKHTTPLLMLTGSKVPHDKEWMRDALAEYIEEELGHQEWILNDIKNTGGDAEAVRRGQPAAATEMMVAYAYDSVNRINPVSFFGMVFVLEGTSTAMATRAAEAIGKSLKLPKKCFTYLTSHGALDISHMEFFRGLMARITDPKDQRAIIHMAKRMFVLYGNVFHSLPHESEARHAA